MIESITVSGRKGLFVNSYSYVNASGRHVAGINVYVLPTNDDLARDNYLQETLRSQEVVITARDIRCLEDDLTPDMDHLDQPALDSLYRNEWMVLPEFEGYAGGILDNIKSHRDLIQTSLRHRFLLKYSLIGHSARDWASHYGYWSSNEKAETVVRCLLSRISMYESAFRRTGSLTDLCESDRRLLKDIGSGALPIEKVDEIIRQLESDLDELRYICPDSKAMREVDAQVLEDLRTSIRMLTEQQMMEEDTEDSPSWDHCYRFGS